MTTTNGLSSFEIATIMIRWAKTGQRQSVPPEGHDEFISIGAGALPVGIAHEDMSLLYAEGTHYFRFLEEHFEYRSRSLEDFATEVRREREERMGVM